MRLYKLTTKNHTTYGGTMWGEGVTKTLPPTPNPKLCTNDVYHAYVDPDLAFLLNRAHADINDPILWEAVGEVVVADTGKVGCFELTTIRIIDPPEWAISNRNVEVTVKFCALLAIEAANMYLKSWQYPADNPVNTALNILNKPQQYTPNDIRAVARQVYAEWMSAMEWISVRTYETTALTWIISNALILGALYNEKQHIEIDETKINLIASDIISTALDCLPEDTDLVRLAKEAVEQSYNK